MLRDMVAPVVGTEPLDAAVLGMPFHDELKDLSAEQSNLARDILPCPALVQNDVRIAFDGAFARQSGVLVLAGTGSMAWASRNGPDDPHFRIGGWGDGFGDEGSAYWIGRESLGLVACGLDGRADCRDFSLAILDEMAVAPGDLIDWMYGLENRRTAIAGIAKITYRLAESGDKTAQSVLERACDCLAAHFRAAKTLMKANAGEDIPWSYAGGVFNSQYVLNGLCARIGSDPCPPVMAPVGGAVLRAAQLAGWNADDAFVKGLSASLDVAFQTLK
jgi:N-acetylglucosamine kinase